MIYLDHCASTPLSSAAKSKLREFIDSDLFANAGASHHAAGQKVAEQIRQCRVEIASLFNVEPKDVFFCSGATEANNMIITGFALSNRDKGARLLIGSTEHASVHESAMAAANRYGAQVQEIPVDRSGRICLDTLEKLLVQDPSRPTLVSTMHTNNEIAVRNPVEEISELCWQYDAAFHCDVVQGLVRESIDCSDLGASTIVFSGHKVGGPKGFGVIIRNLDDRRLKIEPLMLGGQQEGGWRPGTPNTASIVVGTHALVDFHNNRHNYLRHLIECDNAFVQVLQARCPAFELCVPLDPDSPGIVSFHIKGVDADEILLALPHICMSRGAVCKSDLACSHVPAALGLNQQQIKGFLRASFGNGCTLEEVMTAASEISQYIRDKGRPMHLGKTRASAPRLRQPI